MLIGARRPRVDSRQGTDRGIRWTETETSPPVIPLGHVGKVEDGYDTF
jgi:hypothetical protein